MSWVSDYSYSWTETLAMKIIRSGGKVPRHIAFVMDGNRRFAKCERIKKIEGHSKGFDKMADCLRWCLDMGIKEVTAFAFSIENFKRSDEEVNSLLNLARQKFEKLLDESDKLREHGVRIKVIGNIALLPQDLQQLIAKAVLATETNNKLFLNVAFSYTSRDEITQAIETVIQQGGLLCFNDIDERLLEECLYTRHSIEPDLLFRTSGETRISDFLMWQVHSTVLYFTKVLWPRITIWHFFAGVFSYQRALVNLYDFRERKQIERLHTLKFSNYFTERVQTFLNNLDVHRRNLLIKLNNMK